MSEGKMLTVTYKVRDLASLADYFDDQAAAALARAKEYPKKSPRRAEYSGRAEELERVARIIRSTIIDTSGY